MAKKYKFKIYQLPIQDGRTFMELGVYDRLKLNKEFIVSDFRKVYEGERELDSNELSALERLFYEFNINRPIDFISRSMSISDVIVLEGKAYYCDPMGFIPINLVGGQNENL